MEDKNKKMDAALEARVQALDVASDETGDGKVDWQDLKSQLNRIEAQLELQDKQNRSIMKNQRFRLILSVVLAVVLVGAVAFLWLRTNAAYEKILVTCEQVNQLAETVQAAMIESLSPKKERAASAGDFYILSLGIPSVLVECGFLSNAAEEALLRQDAYCERVAAAIADGIADYYALDAREEAAPREDR